MEHCRWMDPPTATRGTRNQRTQGNQEPEEPGTRRTSNQRNQEPAEPGTRGTSRTRNQRNLEPEEPGTRRTWNQPGKTPTGRNVSTLKQVSSTEQNQDRALSGLMPTDWKTRSSRPTWTFSSHVDVLLPRGRSPPSAPPVSFLLTDVCFRHATLLDGEPMMRNQCRVPLRHTSAPHTRRPVSSGPGSRSLCWLPPGSLLPAPDCAGACAGRPGSPPRQR